MAHGSLAPTPPPAASSLRRLGRRFPWRPFQRGRGQRRLRRLHVLAAELHLRRRQHQLPFLHQDGGSAGEHQGSYCGYPGLEIKCNEGQAFLELESGNYKVSSIDYNNLTVQLVDPEVLDGRSSCPITDRNVTLRSFAIFLDIGNIFWPVW